MFQVLDQTKDNLVAIKVKDKVKEEDYDKLNQLIDGALAKSRKAYLYIEMGSLEGVSPSAAWEDLKFDFKNFDNLGKVAIVGESDWEKWMTDIYSAFTTGEVKFFDVTQKEKAFQWLGVEAYVENE